MDNRVWTEADLRLALDRYEEELRAAGKARNTITTYVQHPERFINWLVGTYRPTPSGDATPMPSRNRRSKYQPLAEHLATRREPVVKLSFAQVEQILGQPLPASARRYRPWWGNERNGTHVHARTWLDAGWRTTEVDLNAETVKFIR